MHIAEILKQPGTHFSFEFFPPKTEETSRILFESIRELTPIHPSYVSVTYGAGGSTRELTRDLVVRLKRETQLTVVAHLTTVGASKDETKKLLEAYVANGIENIMALRGDPPKGRPLPQPEDGFDHASDLVAFIKKHFPQLGIGVAGFPEGHPETPNRLKEIDHLKAKVDAGADYICTQLFFDNNDYYDFCERCEIAGIKVPIIAGIMPITTKKGMIRIAELALGARVPSRLLRKVLNAIDDQEVEQAGIRWATQQAIDLFEHKVTGLHFYTLNRSKPTLKIYQALALNSSEQDQ
jgi:methylenetetrahydrofolate reductase (NADPH)